MQKREHALFERVEELRARKAALERGIVPVLARYDILTSRLPLYQLQVGLSPCPSQLLSSMLHSAHVCLPEHACIYFLRDHVMQCACTVGAKCMCVECRVRRSSWPQSLPAYQTCCSSSGAGTVASTEAHPGTSPPFW